MLLFLIVSSSALNSLKLWHEYTYNEQTNIFEEWQSRYNKTYESEEEENHRWNIFSLNAQRIYYFNAESARHDASVETRLELETNMFADLTGQEFREYIHGGSHGYCIKPEWKNNLKNHGSGNKKNNNKNTVKKETLPPSVDWTKKNAVTPIKNQEHCGSCWAFSTTGSVEGALAIKTGNLVSLSEQELIDCSKSYGNDGCGGGLMDNGFKYIRDKKGLCSEKEYPYQAKDGVCQTCQTRYDPISTFSDVTPDSEQDLEEAVFKGPTSIAIEADQFTFQFYKKGVFRGACGTQLDHGVLVVGYGEMAGQKFWKVKNSWGAKWGDHGYIYLCRDCHMNEGKGECGILMDPSYPVA